MPFVSSDQNARTEGRPSSREATRNFGGVGLEPIFFGIKSKDLAPGRWPKPVKRNSGRLASETSIRLVGQRAPGRYRPGRIRRQAGEPARLRSHPGGPATAPLAARVSWTDPATDRRTACRLHCRRSPRPARRLGRGATAGPGRTVGDGTGGSIRYVLVIAHSTKELSVHIITTNDIDSSKNDDAGGDA